MSMKGMLGFIRRREGWFPVNKGKNGFKMSMKGWMVSKLIKVLIGFISMKGRRGLRGYKGKDGFQVD